MLSRGMSVGLCLCFRRYLPCLLGTDTSRLPPDHIHLSIQPDDMTTAISKNVVGQMATWSCYSNVSLERKAETSNIWKCIKLAFAKPIPKTFLGFFLFSCCKPCLLVNRGSYHLESDQLGFLRVMGPKWFHFWTTGIGQGTRGSNVSIFQSISPKFSYEHESSGSLLKMLGFTCRHLVQIKEMWAGIWIVDSHVWFQYGHLHAIL